jgi:outer membrane lipoprotein-sorting protein
MKKILIAFTIFVCCPFLYSEEIDIEGVLLSIQEKWESVHDYTCTATSFAKKGDEEEESVIEQLFMRPKWLRMNIIDGKGKGSVGIYNPNTKKVKGFKTGILKIVVLTLELTDKRVSSIRGHRIDEADWGTLIERLVSYKNNNEFTSVTPSTKDGKDAYLFTAVVSDSNRLWGAVKERVWIDTQTLLPLYVEQAIDTDEVVHFVKYEDIKINTGLEEKDFEP